MPLLVFLAVFGLVLLGVTAIRVWHARRQKRSQRARDIRLFWLLYHTFHAHQE